MSNNCNRSKQSIITVIILFLFNVVPYSVSALLAEGREKYLLSFTIDDYIPFFAPFIVVYFLAYVQWGIGYYVIACESREKSARLLCSNLIAKLICFVIFIAFPTTLLRPTDIGNGPFAFLVGLLYKFDSPINLLPSIHCLESYTVLRFTLSNKTSGTLYKVCTSIFSFLVFASVVFVKQHVFVDIIAGILVLELGILITKLTKVDNVLLKHIKRF